MISQLVGVLGPAYARPLRRMLAMMVAGAVAQGVAFALLVPVLRAVLGPDPAAVWPWLGWLALAAVVSAATHYASQIAGYETGATVSKALHHRLGDQLAGLPLGWFSAERVGMVGRLASQGVVELSGVPAHLLRPLINGFLTPATVVAAMFVFEWRLALAAALCAPLLWASFRLTNTLVQRADAGAHRVLDEAGGRVVEFAQTQSVLRAFGRTVDGHRMLDDALVAQRDAGRSLMRVGLPAFVGFTAVIQAAFTAILLFGTYLVLDGPLQPPELLGLLVLAVRFVEPMMLAGDLGSAMKLAQNALGRVAAVLAEPALPEPAEPKTPVGSALSLSDVDYSYGDRQVLRGVSFEVPERTMTALVGPSGAGKTTVTRLLARFFDVDSGAVRVGGVDVRDVTVATLMAQVSLVFQDVYLFEGSIEDNIRVGKPDATDAEVRAAARQAQVDEIVARLPAGWATPVGEGGASLSGGERQRVSIARAILKDAPIVLLDEATAALDPENEAAVRDALAALTADRTLLVIAHRLATVVAADQIVVLDDGRVAEVGDHESLLAHGGRYADFWAQRDAAEGWRIAAPVTGGTA